MGKIYLIRHGQTDSNSNRQFQGRIDNPLNAKGVAQAEALARYMRNVPLDAIYCSSMLRARMTAAPLAMDHNLPYRPLELLQEVSFGAWEGMAYDEINRRWPEEMTLFLTRPGDWIPPEGESFAEVQKRCHAAFKQIFAEQGHDKSIAIISHGGIIRAQLCALLDMPLNSFWKLAVHNVGISVVEDWDGNFVVESVNVRNFTDGATFRLRS